MHKNIVVAMASLAFFPAASFAATPTLAEVLDASGISVTGHASGSYLYAHRDGGDSQNTFTFNQAALQVSKLPAEGFGGLVDVYGGQDVVGGTFNFPTGFNGFGGANSDFNLHQAYVQYATGGLTVIAGKFATLAGAEVASDAANASGIRSILFTMQPFTHTGVRAAYKFNDMFTAYAGVNNSAYGATTLDLLNATSHDQKTVEMGMALAPIKNLTINVTDYLGTEEIGRTNLLDFVTTYTMGDLSLGLNGDYFTAKTGGVKQSLTGAALYAGYKVNSSFRTAVRGEIVETRDSPLTDKNRVTEVTLTGAYAVGKNFELIGDVVRVWNNQVTPDAPTVKGSVAQLKAVYKF